MNKKYWLVLIRLSNRMSESVDQRSDCMFCVAWVRPHSPTVLKNTLCLFFCQIFCKFESNTTSDWHNLIFQPIRNCVTFKRF